MKNVILILSIVFASCGRQADIKLVPTVLVDQVQVAKLTPKEVSADVNMRAMTLLSYPLSRDIRSWSFSASEETKDSWSMFLDSLKFKDRLVTSFDQDLDPTRKIQEIVTLVQSAGESRDQAFKKLSPLKKELQRIDADIAKAKADLTPKDLETMTCFYAKKPSAGKNFECKSKLEGDYNKEKTTNLCKDFLKFKFIDSEVEARIINAQTSCNELQTVLDDFKTKSKIVDDQIASYVAVRSAGESVVIDLLQSVENANPGLVLIATGGTIEKNKDASEPLSQIHFNGNAIDAISLIIDFGPNLSSGSGKVEYSLENGKITNLCFKQENDGVWTLKFNIVTSDFIVKTNMAYSVHPTLGLRFVGDAHFHYPNGEVRKGVMKLEFDIIK